MTSRGFDKLIAAQRACATWRTPRPHSKGAIPEEPWGIALGFHEWHSASRWASGSV